MDNVEKFKITVVCGSAVHSGVITEKDTYDFLSKREDAAEEELILFSDFFTPVPT
ncbi:unnamed protein product, partial [marine sediment metagenome]